MPLLILLCGLLCSCSYSSTPSLSVRTIYSSAEKLASVKEDTPDPLKPLLGKSHIFLVNWSSPSHPSPILECYYHFEDQKVVRGIKQLDGTSGECSVEVPPSLIRAHGAVNSYKIILVSQGQELAVSKHKLWVPTIHISE